jgi:2'-5' RNA ligase
MTSFHFLLDLPGHINTDIYKLKNEAKRVIGVYPGMNAVPHITVNNYHPNPGDFHEAGFSHFKRPLNALPPVTFEIDGFECFNGASDHGKTIYANIKLNTESKFWLKSLWKTTGKITATPHITIARSLSAEQFNKLWPHFQHRKMQVDFTVSKFTILKVKYIKGEFVSEPYREFDFIGSQNSLSGLYNNYQLSQLKSYSTVSQQISLF